MSAGGNPDELLETADKRLGFFKGSFDDPYLAGIPGPSQAEKWTSDRWPCKRLSINAAPLDRLETYNENIRLWHLRLGAEPLIFNHHRDVPQRERPYTT